MGGVEHALAPFIVMYLLMQIPPTLWEVYCYYMRGGLVEFDISMDDTFHQTMQSYTDWWVYFKRFLDRPKSDAAKAYFAYLDWSATAWDKSIYIHRRLLAKRDWEVHRMRPYVYGPFVFNWKAAHDKQWLRGDDAAGYKVPMWGMGGEARARAEFTAAKEKGYDKWWPYQILRKIALEQKQKVLNQTQGD